ncbi:amidohydrolase family protein [Antarcticimicrobium sediminis]|uniref:Amidohydrolase n=1 Tax=Antarcticimicrobium sediminis TaxID=2546227 RepID=A0A4R5ELX5_9RHOB|nr:amidohydrolase family protein [Antarcticimicrobium sediminis]TDE35655.1 amidohydrolase [Antarcticimicrobium sediminis]
MAQPHAPKFATILPTADPGWLSLHTEEILEPTLPIVDPHHHLWDSPRVPRYLQEEFSADLAVGHNVIATVFAECTESYREDGPERLKPLGETEFVVAFAKEAANAPEGDRGVCKGIIGRADLLEGASVEEVLQMHKDLGQGRWRGIRQSTAHDETGTVRTTARTPPAGVLMDPKFREGFEKLVALGMTFDSWVYHPQLGEVADLAASYPDANIILDHVGGPIGAGAYEGKRDEVFAEWKTGIHQVAAQPNVSCKIGGLGMKLGGFRFETLPQPASSKDLAAAWKPYVETCIEAFGADRCMFESNFPVDMITCTYGTLWNTFKRLASGCSADEKAALFAGTAQRVYSV